MNLPELLKKGVAAHANGQLDHAGVIYRKILEYDARHMKAQYNIGLIDVSTGQYENAFKHFKSALDNQKSISQSRIS